MKEEGADCQTTKHKDGKIFKLHNIGERREEYQTEEHEGY